MYLWRASAIALPVSVVIMSLSSRSFSWKWLIVVPRFARYSTSPIPSFGASPGTCMARPLLPP